MRRRKRQLFSILFQLLNRLLLPRNHHKHLLQPLFKACPHLLLRNLLQPQLQSQ